MSTGSIRCLALVLWIQSIITMAQATGVPGKPTGLRVDTMKPSAAHGVIATLKWHISPSNSTLYYYVRYSEKNSLSPFQKRVRKTSAKIFLKPNSHYIVKVMAFDAKTSGLRGPWSDELKVKTGNSVPTRSPLNVTITTLSSSSVLVKWSPIPQQYRNGKVLGYTVFYRNPNERRWKTRKVQSSLVLQYNITDLKAGESCIVAVAGYTAIGVGKKSSEVRIDRSLPSTPSLPTVPLSTAQVTTPKYVDNHIPKPTTKDGMFTYEMFVAHSETAPVHEIETTVKSPNVEANKHVEPKQGSSITLVYKFIIPLIVGGLALVLLIVFIMWRKRKAKMRHQGGDTVSLTTLGNTQKSKCAVTRGEGSIRYAPPPKSYNASAPPSQPADTHDDRVEQGTTLSVISETEPLKSAEDNTGSQAEPSKARLPYAEVTIVGKDERYVKRNGNAATGCTEHTTNKPAPSSPNKSSSGEAGYENMQHLYDFIDVKDDKGSPLYMNITTKGEEEEGLYEEIPADRQEEHDTVEQPLLDDNHVLGENGKTAV